MLLYIARYVFTTQLMAFRVPNRILVQCIHHCSHYYLFNFEETILPKYRTPTLHLLDISSQLSKVTVFETLNLYKIFYTQQVGAMIIYQIATNFHMLVIQRFTSYQDKSDKEITCVTAIQLFYIIGKEYLNKACLYARIYCHTSFNIQKITVINTATTSQVCATTKMLIA